jgi:hypothetical protein
MDKRVTKAQRTTQRCTRKNSYPEKEGTRDTPKNPGCSPSKPASAKSQRQQQSSPNPKSVLPGSSVTEAPDKTLSRPTQQS